MGKITHENIAPRIVEKPLAMDDSAELVLAVGAWATSWLKAEFCNIFGVAAGSFVPGVLGLVGFGFWLSIGYEYNWV